MNNPSIFNRPRNFRMVLKEVYFWTDIIKDWKKLLAHDDYKKLIIDELRTSFSVVCGPQTTSENNHPHLLPVFAVEEKDREYRIWQRSLGDHNGQQTKMQPKAGLYTHKSTAGTLDSSGQRRRICLVIGPFLSYRSGWFWIFKALCRAVWIVYKVVCEPQTTEFVHLTGLRLHWIKTV